MPCGQAGNTVDAVILTKGTSEQGIVSALFKKNKWPYGPARLGRLPVKEEIAGSNPVRVAIPGGAQQTWEQIGL